MQVVKCRPVHIYIFKKKFFFFSKFHVHLTANYLIAKEQHSKKRRKKKEQRFLQGHAYDYFKEKEHREQIDPLNNTYTIYSTDYTEQ